MSDKKSGHVLLEALGYGAAAALLCRAFANVPVLNFILLLVPSPFIIMAIRRGWLWAALSMGVSLALLYPLGGIAAVVIFAVLIVPVVIITALLFQYKVDSFYTALISSVAFAVAVILLIESVKWLTGNDIFYYIKNALQSLFKSANMNSSFWAMFQPDQDAQVSAADMAASVTDLLKMMLPSIIMIISLAAGFLNMMVAGQSLKKAGADISDIQPFHDWALPNDAVKGMVGILAVSFICMILGINGFDIVFSTLLGLISFIFAVQGLATLDYIFLVSGMGTTGRVVLMIVNFVLFQILLTLLGIAEQIFHIRRNIKNRYNGGGTDQ